MSRTAEPQRRRKRCLRSRRPSTSWTTRNAATRPSAGASVDISALAAYTVAAAQLLTRGCPTPVFGGAACQGRRGESAQCWNADEAVSGACLKVGRDRGVRVESGCYEE